MHTKNLQTLLRLLILLVALPVYAGQAANQNITLPDHLPISSASTPPPPPRKVYLLYNPTSGKKSGEKIADLVQSLLNEAGIEVSLQATSHPQHATELALSLPMEGYDGFCVVGGDGTIHETINGLLKRGDTDLPPLCVIPAGTGNSFSRDLLLDEPLAAIAAIKGGRTKAVDVGSLTFQNADHHDEQRYMINMLGLGLGVDANLQAEQLRWLGPKRYNVGILWEIMKKRHHLATVTIDGTPIEGDFSIVLIQNTKRGGDGLLLAPDAAIDDGQLDILLAPRLSQVKMLKLFSRIAQDGSHVNSQHVTYKKFKALTIDSPSQLPLNIDGENCGTTPLSLQVLPNKLRVFY